MQEFRQARSSMVLGFSFLVFDFSPFSRAAFALLYRGAPRHGTLPRLLTHRRPDLRAGTSCTDSHLFSNDSVIAPDRPELPTRRRGRSVSAEHVYGDTPGRRRPTSCSPRIRTRPCTSCLQCLPTSTRSPRVAHTPAGTLKGDPLVCAAELCCPPCGLVVLSFGRQ